MTAVTIDARYLGPGPSGVGRYIRETLGGVQALRPEWDFDLVVRRRGDEGALRARRTVAFDAWPYGLATTLGLALRTGSAPGELFHSPFHVLPRGLRCRTVLTMHDAFHFDQPRLSNHPFPINWLEYGYFMATIPESIRRADRVICVSRTTADEVVRRVPGCAAKLHVVHHGVSEFFAPTDPDEGRARAARLTGGDDPFVLAVGGVSPNKNHPAMLRAFARAFPEPSSLRWVSVNRFGDVEGLRRLAAELGLGRRFVAVRSASDDDLRVLFGAARFFSFCSLVEGFGIPVIEAMACGCPVLTSDRTCLPEIGGDAALYADPTRVDDMAAKMLRVEREGSLRDELRARGIERAAGFTVRESAERTLEVYELALG